MKRLFAIATLSLGVVSQSLAAPGAESQRLIQIGVEVVEVDEAKTQNLGIDWISKIHVFEQSVPALLEVGTFSRGAIFADLEAMLQEGTADLLANPKLVTRDGSTASFHAGGELPYAVADGLGTATVEFKPYGINLKINPHFESSGLIAMTIDAEVSGPDSQTSVTLAGNTVPGIRSRTVNSQLTLSPGSTLTLAGLIQNEKVSLRKGIPGLMDIPLLGSLFSHKSQANKRTSIVVFVTPTVIDLPGAPAVPSARLAHSEDDFLATENEKDRDPTHG